MAPPVAPAPPALRQRRSALYAVRCAVTASMELRGGEAGRSINSRVERHCFQRQLSHFLRLFTHGIPPGRAKCNNARLPAHRIVSPHPRRSRAVGGGEKKAKSLNALAC